MVDFSESDEMIRICGKVDKSNTYTYFVLYSQKNFFRLNIFLSFSTFSAIEEIDKIMENIKKV